MSEPTPTDRELEALKVLWERREASVRDVCDAMNAKGEDLAYTTVLSLLQVMEQKGLVGHRRVGRSYLYAPNIPRERTFRSLATEFLERVFDGAVDQYLVHALDARGMSADELDRLEQMIADARRRTAQSKTPNKKRGRK